jgi:hypothetical protein
MQNEIERLYAQKKDVESQFRRLLENKETPFFKESLIALMDLSNTVDLAIIRQENDQRQQELDMDIDWDSENNKYAEGHRQFLINQFEGITGKQLNKFEEK